MGGPWGSTENSGPPVGVGEPRWRRRRPRKKRCWQACQRKLRSRRSWAGLRVDWVEGAGQAELGGLDTRTAWPQSPTASDRVERHLAIHSLVLNLCETLFKALSLPLVFTPYLLTTVDVPNGGQEKVDHFVVESVKHSGVE